MRHALCKVVTGGCWPLPRFGHVQFDLGCCVMHTGGGTCKWLATSTATDPVSCRCRWWPEGRLTNYQADNTALAYPYSGKVVEAEPWHPAVLEIKVPLRWCLVCIEQPPHGLCSHMCNAQVFHWHEGALCISVCSYSQVTAALQMQPRLPARPAASAVCALQQA